MYPAIMFAVSAVTAYLIGAFPTSYLLTKTVKGIDIRQAGSNNAGATNVLRVAGRLPALVTLIVDILKGVLVVTVVSDFFYGFEPELDYNFYRSLLGLMAISGHIWPVFLRFHGGKGVATTLGVVGVIAFPALSLSLVMWLVIFFATGYVSLASIVLLFTIPIFAAIMNYPFYTVLLLAVIAVIGIYKHSANIKRLLRNEENRTDLFKKRGRT